MEERKSQKKEISKDAQQLLKEGTPKQQVFETLVDKYKYSKDVADVLKNIPSLQRIQKYGAWNNLLLFLVIIIELFSLFFSSPSFGIVWYGLLIYSVAKKNVKYYSWITFISAIGIIVTIIVFLVSSSPIQLYSIIILVFIFIPSCVLPIWLEKRLCPEPIERKEMYTNASGERRMRTVYEFNDM